MTASKHLRNILIIILIVIMGYVHWTLMRITLDVECVISERSSENLLVPSHDNGDDYRLTFLNKSDEFQWKIRPTTSECDARVEFLVLIASNPRAFSRRLVLRETWINSSRLIENGIMKVLFVLGDSANEKINKMVQVEADLHDDIIQASFLDNYQNLTYKSFTGLLYATSKCRNFKFVVKIDEDVIFFPDALYERYIRGHLDPDRDAIYGGIHEAGVAVSRTGKWKIERDDYKCENFPTYVSGTMYIMTKMTAVAILRESRHRKFITVEDVLITGLLAFDVGAVIYELDDFYPLQEFENRFQAFFMIGKSKSPTVQKLVHEESKLYDDIILADFKDAYRNLTYKTITSFVFAVHKCKTADYFLKLDDDVIFFPDQLFDAIDKGAINANELAFYGNFLSTTSNMAIEVDDKWYVPSSSYSCSLYPPYQMGMFYIMRMEVARHVLNATRHRKHMTVEDALITGLYAYDIGIKNYHWESVYLRFRVVEDASIIAMLAPRKYANYSQLFYELMKNNCPACKVDNTTKLST
ncbi:unnamed protein product [Caenorhabditis bovis]|uniref:Hexosyltransferase n=1 Tax=Caenorhabditis bovis TaxID=2654633 RepID=A0A8S1EN69_9PELO|nr:unnamed protein product [Caenorhabditis bovis]